MADLPTIDDGLTEAERRRRKLLPVMDDSATADTGTGDPVPIIPDTSATPLPSSLPQIDPSLAVAGDAIGRPLTAADGYNTAPPIAAPTSALPQLDPSVVAAGNAIGRPLTAEDGYPAAQPPAIAAAPDASAPDPTAAGAATGEGDPQTSGMDMYQPYIDPRIRPAIADKTGELIEASKYHDKHWSKWDKIAAALQGWAQGGIFGAVKAVKDPHFFEDQRIAEDRARILPQIAALNAIDASTAGTDAKRMAPMIHQQIIKAKYDREKQAFGDRMKLAQDKAKAEGNKWKVRTNPQTGELEKVYENRGANDPEGPQVEPYLDANGSRVVDPNSQLYEWTDPTSGQTVRIKGAALATAGATIAAGNAQREQSAAEKSAAARQATVQRNTQTYNNYMNQLQQARTAIATQAAQIGTQVPEFDALQQQMGILGAQLAALDAKDPDVDKKRQALINDFNKNQQAFVKSAAGDAQKRQAVEILKNNLPPMPKFEDMPEDIPASRVTIPKHLSDADKQKGLDEIDRKAKAQNLNAKDTQAWKDNFLNSIK